MTARRAIALISAGGVLSAGAVYTVVQVWYGPSAPQIADPHAGQWPWTTETMTPYSGPVAPHALVMGAKYHMDGREGRLMWHAAGRRSDFSGLDHGRVFLVADDGSVLPISLDRVRRWWRIDDPPKAPPWQHRSDPEFRPWYADQMDTMPPPRRGS